MTRGVSSDRCKDLLWGGRNLYAVVFTDYSAWSGDGFFSGVLFHEKAVHLTESKTVVPT